MCSCSSTLCKLSYGRRPRSRSNRKTRNGGWTTSQDCAPCQGQVSVQSQRFILTLHRRAHVSLRAEQWQQEGIYHQIWWLHTSSTKVKWFDHMREAYFYVDTPATKLKKKDQKNLSWQHTAHDVFLGAPFGK